MSDIQVLTQTVYRAPTKGRRYLTARAAAIAEAGAMLELKYPSERPEWDVGDPGWHWRSDEAHLRTHRRLSRMILRRLRVATPKDADPRELLETALNRIEDMLSDDDGQAFKEARKFLPVGRAALAAQPGSVGEWKHIPIEPTDAMLNEGAQRLVSWGEDSKWPDSWSKLQVKAAKNEAERVWRSMWLAAPTESKPAQDAVDAERYRLVRRGQHWSVIDGIGNVLRGDDLDAAIDAKKGQP